MAIKCFLTYKIGAVKEKEKKQPVDDAINLA